MSSISTVKNSFYSVQREFDAIQLEIKPSLSEFEKQVALVKNFVSRNGFSKLSGSDRINKYLKNHILLQEVNSKIPDILEKLDGVQKHTYQYPMKARNEQRNRLQTLASQIEKLKQQKSTITKSPWIGNLLYLARSYCNESSYTQVTNYLRNTSPTPKDYLKQIKSLDSFDLQEEKGELTERMKSLDSFELEEEKGELTERMKSLDSFDLQEEKEDVRGQKAPE